jgi:hypothetical protein
MPAGEVVLEALQKISARDTAALSEDAEDVVRYLRCAGGEQTNRRERAR